MVRAPFLWAEGGQAVTPDELRRRREIADALAERGSDTGPVGHWSQGLARLVDAWGGYRGRKIARDTEASARAGALERIEGDPVLSTLLGGGSVSPGERATDAVAAALAAGGQGGGSGGATPVAMNAAAPVNGDWLRYANQGATRNQPISGQLQEALSFLPELGVTMEVFSGGQPGQGEGGGRVGSTRHDHGNAADVRFFRDGRQLDWANPEDLPIFEEIVRQAAARGVTGFGAGEGYMQPGTMHIGFGAPAVWGAGGSGANAPGWLRNAAADVTGTGAVPSGGGAYAPPSQATVAALMGAMADPWIAEVYGQQIQAALGQQQAMQQAQFQQQLAQSDPMYQIGLQQAQLELDAMLNPQVADPTADRQAFALAGGLQPGSPEYNHYMLTGEFPSGPEMPDAFRTLDARAQAAGLVPGTPDYEAFMASGGDVGTSAMREYDLYAQQAAARGEEVMPFDAWDIARRQAGAQQINLGQGDPVWGDAPPNMTWLRGPDGKVITEPDDSGRGVRPVAVPVSGGPVDREDAELATMAEQQQQQIQRYGQIVLDDINRALEVLEGSPMLTAGPGGAILSGIPGTRAHDLSNLVDTIRANVGFDRLQAMRAASPTGGALGAVSDNENRMLQATLGNLSQSQSSAQFGQNLRRLRELYTEIIHGPAPEGVAPEDWVQVAWGAGERPQSGIGAPSPENAAPLMGTTPPQPQNLGRFESASASQIQSEIGNLVGEEREQAMARLRQIAGQ